MNGLLLGIDAGLTAIKAGVFDREGRSLAQSVRRCPRSLPAPDWVERDMGLLWAACKATIRECVQATAHIGPIAAVGIAGHGDGLYLIDDALRPVRPALLPLDTRAKAIVQEWGAEGKAASVLKVCGEQPWTGSPVVLYEWVLRNERESAAKARWLLSSKDWIRLNLTGSVATDPTDASPWTGVSGTGYCSDVLRLLSVSEDSVRPKLPPIAGSGAVAGTVLPSIAGATGLAPGTPVVCGSHDVDASAIGMGAALPGQLALLAGTFSIAQAVSSSPHPGSLVRTRTFVTPGNWLNMVAAPGAASLDWFVRTFWDADGSYDLIEEELTATDHRRGGLYFHPYLYGDGMRPNVSAAIVGLRAWHNRSEVLHAVMEGVVCGFRRQVEALAGKFQCGSGAALAGGAARSPYWSQLLSDGLGMDVQVCDTDEPGTRGAALLAGLSLGFWPDLNTAVSTAVRVARRHTPDPTRVAALDRTYQAFRALDEALEPLWGLL